MSDVFLDHDTTEETLAAQLPEYMPKDPNSGNFRLLSTIAERIDDLDSDISAVDRAKNAQTADTIEQLDHLARLVDLKPYQDETLEHFRSRVISEFQLVTSEGTVNDLLTATATILNTRVNSIRYTEQHTSGSGRCQVGVPSSKLSDIELSDTEFIEIVDQLIPSSYAVDVLLNGTFSYVSVSDYESGNFGRDYGYDGLDSGGDPKNNGGTYAGVLE